MQYSLQTLEFSEIKKLIKRYLFSSGSEKDLELLSPSNDFSVVKTMLLETNEALEIINKYGQMPFSSNFDNNLINQRVLEGNIYSIDELLVLKQYLLMENEFYRYFKILEDVKLINHLSSYTNLYDHLPLLNKLEKVISNYGEIYDDASIELLKVRQSLKRLNLDLEQKLNKLANSLSEHLTDTTLVKRNNRYCLQVTERDKHKVKGIIHDVSKSGQTIFIEPELSIKLSNEIELYKKTEAKEVLIILSNLTNEVINFIDTLRNNLNNLVKLDLISAKAMYARTIDAIMPNINNEGITKLVNAKHPLIDFNEVVPISLELNNEFHTLLITGPNTGGKTVSLKTVGLLSIMVQSGILVPVNHLSDFNVYEQILADIGDSQSIFTSLSTFSSHMNKIISFIDNLKDNSLILLDELGSGTDPIEGVSLAISIIEELLKKNIKLVVTSHFSELKTYAIEQNGFKTASVAFDIKTLKPLYYLEHGLTGNSHARLIASRLGMRESVIKRADALYLNRETDIQKVMNKLALELKELEIKEQEFILSKANYDKLFIEVKELKEQLISEQESKVSEAIKVETKKWQERELEVDNLIKEIEKDYQSHHLATLKNLKSKKISQNLVETNDDFKKGDRVYIKSYQQFGEVVSVKDSDVRVLFGIFDLTFNKNELKYAKEEPKKVVRKKATKQNNNLTKQAIISVDLRGLRYEEVREKLDDAFDNALLSNINSLTIIHGFGTGAVKSAVNEYLKKSSLVKSYRLGGEGEGLGGATIVTLK